MDTTSWNFSLANYGAVWSFLVQLGLLLMFLMLGNILRRKIPFFRNCLIPSALLGGGVLLVVNIICKQFDIMLIDNRLMQVITYHCLAIGFAAMTLKTEKSTHKTKRSQVLEFGALQGPGNALSWDINFTNTPQAQFAGNGSFGLSLASIGFVVASVFGVFYINIHKKRGDLKLRSEDTVKAFDPVELTEAQRNELPDNESVDKFSLQIGFVAIAYAISFGFMCLLGAISDFTNNIAWGFNFLWASLAAMIIKFAVKFLRKHELMHRQYINNYQMDRISGFSFDLMIVAGVTAIEINDIKNYILPIVILSIVGTVFSYAYIRLVAKECFKGFEHEFFLMSFGTLTGTASNGMILMKEIDPSLHTPTSSLYILSNFPAMIMIAPLLLTLNFAARSTTNAIIACVIFFVLWISYTVFLFRRRIFRKKYKDVVQNVWQEEEQNETAEV